MENGEFFRFTEFEHLKIMLVHEIAGVKLP